NNTSLKQIDSLSEKDISSQEEIFIEKINKLLKYFDFPEDKNCYKIKNDSSKDLLNIILYFSLDGIPDRSQTFIVSLSKTEKTIKRFFYRKFPCPTKVDIPEEPPITIIYQKARELIKEELDVNTYNPKILDNVIPKLVIAPNKNEFEFDKRGEKQYISSYVWEIDFTYIDEYTQKQIMGVIWLDLNCKKIWGISRIKTADNIPCNKYNYHPCK
ncbi:MAG: hypothetical protein ACP5UA_12170, partial [Candidatus Hydrogenedens sp.]